MQGSADAIATWIRRRVHVVDLSRLDQLRTIDDVEARASLIATLLEEQESDEVAAACIDALTELPHELAVPLLPAIAVAAPQRSPIVRANACFALTRFGVAELATPVLGSLRSLVGTSVDPEIVTLVVPPMLRAMRWLGLEAEIAATLDHVLRRTPPEDLPERFRFVVAGALVSVGNELGTTIIDAAIERSFRVDMPIRLTNVRAIAAGASYADRDRGFAIMRRLFVFYKTVTDSYGTNSHYCLSVLRYIEPLVLAVCDLELANLEVLEPTSQRLLGSGFAF